MAKYVRGQVVWAKAEKSAQGGFKERPVVIVGSWPFDGGLDHLVMICSTSTQMDPYRFEFSNQSFKSGGFPDGDDAGWIRPTYLTVVRNSDVLELVGVLKDEVFEQALVHVRSVVR